MGTRSGIGTRDCMLHARLESGLGVARYRRRGQIRVIWKSLENREQGGSKVSNTCTKFT